MSLSGGGGPKGSQKYPPQCHLFLPQIRQTVLQALPLRGLSGQNVLADILTLPSDVLKLYEEANSNYLSNVTVSVQRVHS